jgi:hypothetical protein
MHSPAQRWDQVRRGSGQPQPLPLTTNSYTVTSFLLSGSGTALFFDPLTITPPANAEASYSALIGEVVDGTIADNAALEDELQVGTMPIAGHICNDFYPFGAAAGECSFTTQVTVPLSSVTTPDRRLFDRARIWRG